MKRSSGFTMIELLMAMALMGILSSLALPMVVDFRNEGKAAVVRENLKSMRQGVKSQIRQAMLRCNVSTPDSWQTAGGTPFFEALGMNLYYNDITHHNADPAYSICTPAQVPANSRGGWLVEGALASNIISSIDTGSEGEHPRNPFVDVDGPQDSYEMVHITNDMITALGDVCTVAVSFGYTSHWLYNLDTGLISPGTDTAGIHECSF